MRRTLYALAHDPNKKFGTLEEQTLRLAEAFRARGSLLVPLFQQHPTGRFAAAYSGQGLPAEGLDLSSFRLERLRVLLRLLDRYRIEVINWNFYGPRNPYVLGLSVLRPGVAHYYTNHTSRPATTPCRRGLLDRVKRLAYRHYEHALGVSDFVVGWMAEEGWPRQLGRFWHFVNVQRFCPDPEVRHAVRRRHAVDSRFVILAVSQLIPEKGIHVLLEALTRLPTDVVLWIVGSGRAQAPLEEQASANGTGDRVVFFGQQENVACFTQAADLAVLPSLWQEAAGLVILEALACGLPVIASRVGGIPEYVHPGQTGFLVPPGDAEALAQAIRTLYDDRALAGRLGERGRAWVVQHCSIEATLERNLAVYRHA